VEKSDVKEKKDALKNKSETLDYDEARSLIDSITIKGMGNGKIDVNDFDSLQVVLDETTKEKEKGQDESLSENVTPASQNQPPEPLADVTHQPRKSPSAPQPSKQSKQIKSKKGSSFLKMTSEMKATIKKKEKKSLLPKNESKKEKTSSKNLFSKKLFSASKQELMPPQMDERERQRLLDESGLGSEEQLSSLKTYAIKQERLQNISAWTEFDFYPLIKPFSYVSIIQNTVSRERRYLILEHPLTPEEREYLDFIMEGLQTISLEADEVDDKGTEQILLEKVDELIHDYNLDIPFITKEKILYILKKNLLGLGLLDPFMQDGEIEDISCDGAEIPIFLYHRKHGSIQSNIRFPDEDELSAFVMRLAQKCGKHISIAHPMIDATMPDGSRIQMTLSTEVSTKGSTFTIRKFREQPFSPSDLIKFNSMSAEMMAYMWLAVEHGVNALIAGGTASGKTSSLNALALFIPRQSKIVTIEETREINLPHPNWIPGVARSGFGDVVDGKMTGEINMYDLMKAALRQRPEYIIVGEIRGREAYVLFQAMATGHTTYSTVHADSTKSLIHRLEGEPINIPRIMLQSLDVLCLQTITRVKNKRARRCKQIIEIIDIDPSTKEILTNEVFRWDPVQDSFKYSGKSYVLEQIRAETNQTKGEITAELNQRARVLEWMVMKNIHVFDDVANVTANYIDHPDEVMRKVEDPSAHDIDFKSPDEQTPIEGEREDV
jgi:flagellar protein FlaI